VASETLRLLADVSHYQRCSKSIKERVHTYYNRERQKKTYNEIYHELISTAKMEADAEKVREAS
ncbi:MAG: hypothetical protein KDD76_03010, partial [Rickettsiales bacterium]|nr:hypothetical protein [Rickettsiales bacterium]